MKKLKKKLNILGVEYSISISNEQENERMKDNNGYVDFSTKEIHLAEDLFIREPKCMEVMSYAMNRVLRHEMTHAFFHESGMFQPNEEVIEWIAKLLPKLWECSESFKFTEKDIIK